MRTFFQRLAPYLRPHRWLALVLLAGLSLELGFESALRMSLKFLIDEAIVPRRGALLAELLAGLTALGVLATSFAMLCDWLWARLGARVMNALRADMFSRMQRLSPAWYSRASAGDLVSRFTSDVAAVESGLILAIPAGLTAIASIVFSTALLFRLDWRLALLALSALPVIVVVTRLLGARALQAGYLHQVQEAKLAAVVQENVSAQALVKGLSLEQQAQRDFGRSLDGLFTVATRFNGLSYLLQRTPSLGLLVVHLLVLGVGARLAFHGALSVGSLVAFSVLLLGVGSSVNALTWVLPYLATASAGMERVREILEAEPDVKERPGATPLGRLSEEIRFEDVHFSHGAGRSDLVGIDLVIPAGAHVALVGHSGAGRSTLLQLLLRFGDPSQGKITWDGRDLKDATLSSLRAQLGVVFQESVLFNSSVGDNIRLGKPGASDAEVEQAARAAGIHDFIASLPLGYDTLAAERGARFSGGQRQRMALARALLRDPAILLLDEPTSALDPLTEAAVQATITEVAKGRTVIEVTHDMAAAARCDLIFVFEAGRLIEEGTHSELLKRNGAWARLFGVEERRMDDSQQGEATRISIGAAGRSLVAAEALPAGTAVARFEGPTMPYPAVPEEERRHAIGMSGGMWLVTRSRARWLNHSCAPNCEIWEDLSVVSTRPIDAGEELTFSYDVIERESFERAPGEFFWDPRWSFDCRCGAERCVGKIDRYRFAGEGPQQQSAGRKT